MDVLGMNIGKSLAVFVGGVRKKKGEKKSQSTPVVNA